MSSIDPHAHLGGPALWPAPPPLVSPPFPPASLRWPGNLDVAIVEHAAAVTASLGGDFGGHTFGLRLEGMAFGEASATVTFGDRPTVAQVATGPDALRTVQFLVLRRALFGDAPVCGVLVNGPRFRAELWPDAAAAGSYFLDVYGQAQGASDQPSSGEARLRVWLEAPRAGSRTRYLRVNRLPRWLEVELADRLPGHQHLRLHQLVLALAGIDVRRKHCHHRNGCGYDCRVENLEAVAKGAHADRHVMFLMPGGEVLSRLGDETADAELADWDLRPSQLASLAATGVRHIRNDEALQPLSSFQPSSPRFRVGLDATMAAVEAGSRRKDAIQNMKRVVLQLWLTQAPVEANELARALSLSRTAVRKIAKKLEGLGVLTVDFVRGRQVLSWEASSAWSGSEEAERVPPGKPEEREETRRSLPEPTPAVPPGANSDGAGSRGPVEVISRRPIPPSEGEFSSPPAPAEPELSQGRCSPRASEAIGNLRARGQATHFDDLVPEFLDSKARELGRKAAKTIKAYRQDLSRASDVLGGLEPRAITTAMIEAYLRGLTTVAGGPVAPATANRHHGALSAFFTWLLARGSIAANPLKGVQKARLKDPDGGSLSPEHQAELLRRAKRAGLREEALVTLLLETGLGIGEALNVDVGDVDLAGMIVRVREGMGGKARQVYLTPDALPAIRRYLGARPDKSPAAPLFRSNRGRMSYPRAAAVFKAIAAGMANPDGSPLHLRQLRHTYAAHQLAKGVDPGHVAALTGHEALRTLRRYTKGAKEAAADAEVRDHNR